MRPLLALGLILFCLSPSSQAAEDCISFNPKKIAIKKIESDWKIVDGDHWIVSFAEREQEAREAFAIIKKYKYSKQCFVGRPNASFTYWK